MYSPALGRFLQTDPVGYSDNLNVYTYASNDSLNRLDPTGQSDLNLINVDNEPMYSRSESFFVSGAFVVTAHGNAGFVADHRSKYFEHGTPKAYILEAEELFAEIQKTDTWDNGEMIVLLSCHSANFDVIRGNNFAQQLANVSGSRVIAAEDRVNYLSVKKSGREVISMALGLPGQAPNGKLTFKLFSPGGVAGTSLPVTAI